MADETKTDATSDDKTQDEIVVPGLGEAGKEALRKERADRKAAAARADAAESRLAAIEKATQDAAAAKAKADEDTKIKADESRGEYEAAKTTLATERDAEREKAKTLEARITGYEDALKPTIEAVKADLPDEALTDYPTDADAVTRLSWLNARTALIAAIRPSGAQRSPLTPRAQTPNAAQLAEQTRAQLRQTGSYDF